MLEFRPEFALGDILDPRLRGGAGRYGVRVKKEAKEERKN
ncbi:unnamed protein product [marine sediment metagenome]|uniref:Uncharacterized protein n=1 Tax=marine sediment metagenome TaxID=412755 RepID=X1V802_9ZZZZ